jgi:tetratricopeptide (TPR) repeat protein
MNEPHDLQRVVLDAENPWPGLHEFDERGQAFFNGRETEVAELMRLVGNAPLSVLFGGSGLGKTSLLLAGLVPALRSERKLPVYVRLDPRDRSAPLIEQARTRLRAELESAHVDHPPMADGETLWDYLHRLELELWSSDNQLLTPVFIFDQFEEVFTLGSENADAVRQLRDDLADLIENRVPAALAPRIEQGDPSMAAMDILAHRFKVVLSFREDFLPDIEEWRPAVPSLARNRLRLLPMNGQQAYDAVLKTGGRLVTPAVSDAIVAFVAVAQGGAKSGQGAADAPGPALIAQSEILGQLTIDPALLSLVCTGLNDRRHAAKKPAIDDELLAGTGQAIVAEFYEGCVRDIPLQTRRFIEDHLITEGGFRNPYSRSDALSQRHISESDLKALVNRRLLRVERHLGADRIELVHDLLTSVVRRFRDEERVRQQAALDAARSQRDRRRFLALAVVALVAIVTGAVFFSFWRSAEDSFARYKVEETLRKKAEAGQRTSEAALAKERARNESIKALEDADRNRTNALALAMKKQYPQALALLDKSLATYRRVGDSPRAVRTQVDRGKIQELAQRVDLAAADFSSALSDATARQDPGLQGLALEAQASLEARLEHAAEALALYTQAHQKYEEAGDSLAAARVLEWLATRAETLQQFDRAAASYRQALSRYQIAGDGVGTLRSRNAIARVTPWGYLVNLKSNAVFAMRGDRITIGRDSPDGGIRNELSFANQLVSRRHLVINRDGFQADDVRSRNGTSVNGQTWPYGVGKKLADRDIIALANVEVLQFFTGVPVLPSRPARAWGILIGGSPRQTVYLTEESYSLKATAGGVLAEPGISDGALASLRVANGKIEMMDLVDEWEAIYVYKESDYDYRTAVLPSGQWFDVTDLPPLQIVKLSADREKIAAKGPSFQIVAIGGK